MSIQYMNSFIHWVWQPWATCEDTGRRDTVSVSSRLFNVTEISSGCLGHTQDGHLTQGLGDRKGSQGRWHLRDFWKMRHSEPRNTWEKRRPCKQRSEHQASETERMGEGWGGGVPSYTIKQLNSMEKENRGARSGQAIRFKAVKGTACQTQSEFCSENSTEALERF